MVKHLALKLLTTFTISTFGLILIITTPSLANDPLEHPSEAKFQHVLKTGQTVSYCLVPGVWIHDFIESLPNSFSRIGLVHCTITGDLNLPALKAPLELTLSDCTVKGTLSMYGADHYRIIDLSRITVEGPVYFSTSSVNRFIAEQASFKQYVWISEINFTEDVSFFSAKFWKGADFEKDSFSSTLNCSFADDSNSVLRLIRCGFVKDAVFDHLNNDKERGTLRIGDSYFESSFYGESMKLDTLALGRYWIGDTKYCSGPNRFADTATFYNLDAVDADISEVVFSKYADLGDMHCKNSINFANTAFEDDANFDGTFFPQSGKFNSSGACFAHTRFSKPPQISCSQLCDARPWWAPWQSDTINISPNESSTWRMWEDNFHHADDVAAENEMEYFRGLAEYADPQAQLWPHWNNIFERYFWGYGVRPLRIGGWMLVAYTIFTCLYWWTIRKEDVVSRPNESQQIAKLRYAMDFSRRTAFLPLYGLSHSITPVLKIVTAFQWVLFLALSVAILDSLSRVSPLFHTILGKVLTI
jgi:hypothetical protein